MRVFRIAVLVSSMAAFSSCRQYSYVYSPAKLNTPLLRKKNDSRLNASFSSGGAHGQPDTSLNSGLDVQSAYAISDHWGVMATFDEHWEKDAFSNISFGPFTDSRIGYRRRNCEIGTVPVYSRLKTTPG